MVSDLNVHANGSDIAKNNNGRQLYSREKGIVINLLNINNIQ